MNSVDGACACCGKSSQYTGKLPNICPTCREAREQMIAGGGVAQLISGGKLNTRLLLPDSELMPRPVTGG